MAALQREKQSAQLSLNKSDSSAEVPTAARVANQSWLEQLFLLPGKILQYIRQTALPLRYAMPAIAAALIVIVVLPRIAGQNEFLVGIPESLTKLGVDSSHLIDLDNATSFGFSTTSNAHTAAFNRGALFVDLVLSVESQNRTIFKGITDRLSSLTAAQQQPDLKQAIVALEQVVFSASTHSDRRSALNEFGRTLSTYANEPQSRQWFAQGQATEAIVLSGQLALKGAAQQALQDALTANTKLDISELNHPVVKLISELRATSSTTEFKPAQLREILTTASNLKILLQ